MERLMVTLNENINDDIRQKLAEENVHIIFETKLMPCLIGVEADSLVKVQNFEFVKEATHERIGTLLTD